MKPLNKKRYAIILLALGITSSLVYVFYSHKYSLAYTILPAVFLLGVWLLVLNIWVPSSWTNRIPFLFRQFIYGIPLVLLFSLLFSLSNNYQLRQLKKYGVIVDGTVTDTHIVDNRHEGSHFYIEIAYSYKGKTYQQRLTDSIYRYKYHDELKVLCSSNDPEIFRIVGHKPALNIKY